MKINDYVEIFNAMIRGTPVSFTEKLIPLYSDYLTENNIENSDKLINLIVQNPDLIQVALPKIVEYYINKYSICSISYNNKIILYYAST